jgi:phosphoribosylformimino-5-aminoimidazole carboxamide ribotide isomerase
MIEIIPAIDIIEGRCVRLERGDFSRKTEYSKSPLEMAKSFESQGVRRLHIVDLEGAKEQSTRNLKVLEEIVQNTGLSVDFGGGIRTRSQIERLFNAGADYLTIGSMAVKNASEFTQILEEMDPVRFIMAADSYHGKVATEGWMNRTTMPLEDFLDEYRALGVKEVMCTDITKDGMLEGIDLDFYARLRAWFPDLNIIASGGVTSEKDIKNLQMIGIDRVIVGKAIYEGRISLEKLIENR